MGYLDASHFSFKSGSRVEAALVTIVNKLGDNLDKGSVCLLILLDFLVVFDTISSGILLFYSGFYPSRRIKLTRCCPGNPVEHTGHWLCVAVCHKVQF